MYRWIWRHLPFGTPGKIFGSVALAALGVALLWYAIFPAVEPHLPFNDGQVTTAGDPGVPAPSSSPSPSPSPAGSSPSARPSAVRSPARARTRRTPAAAASERPPASPSPAPTAGHSADTGGLLGIGATPHASTTAHH